MCRAAAFYFDATFFRSTGLWSFRFHPYAVAFLPLDLNVALGSNYDVSSSRRLHPKALAAAS